MKKTLAFLLAIAMLAGMAVNAFAVTEPTPNYPVDDISSNGYLLDDDESKVDLTDDVDMVPYGETVYFPLVSHSSGTKYVYEKAAAGNMKISKKWEEGGSYVDEVSVVRKKITSDSMSLTEVPSASNGYIYFLAITVDKSSSTTTRELYGQVTIKQSGTKDYAKVDSLDVDISIEMGYSSASKKGTEGEIPITPATFKDGDGFDSDSEFEFSFEADSDSRFVVNTNGQGKIVLGLDTDYDDKIGDKYPDADLYFFNGNYATFNRTGTLYLGSEDDDLYVYAIASNGSLSRVNAEYDDSEEAYVINTRTLGRYVLSSEKLSTTSTGSSSSSTSTSISTAVRPSSSAATAVTSTPTYTPPVSSRPASTPPASQPSSTVESSEPPEEEEPEEPEEEEPEEEEPEEDDVVDVVVDDNVDDEPQKKKGLPGWTWALIIIGLAAIPVAIGVIYFIQNRPTRREFFDDNDGDYDDDDDE